MKTLGDIAQQLTPRGEFFAIISICLGYPIITSQWMMTRLNDISSIDFTTDRLLFMIVFEVSSLFVAGYILSCRGWRLGRLNLEVSWKLSGAGILLLALYYVGYACLFHIFGVLTGSTQALIDSASKFTANAPASVVIWGSMINALFEEAVVVGYVVKALEKEGALFAIGVSTLLRFAYHTYQGPLAIVSILPLGVLFAFVYWRCARLWPLIFAHFLLDVIFFASRHS
jgi:membrane protease YdiL (CAAX protease family)